MSKSPQTLPQISVSSTGQNWQKELGAALNNLADHVEKQFIDILRLPSEQSVSHACEKLKALAQSVEQMPHKLSGESLIKLKTTFTLFEQNVRSHPPTDDTFASENDLQKTITPFIKLGTGIKIWMDADFKDISMLQDALELATASSSLDSAASSASAADSSLDHGIILTPAEKIELSGLNFHPEE